MLFSIIHLFVLIKRLALYYRFQLDVMFYLIQHQLINYFLFVSINFLVSQYLNQVLYTQEKKNMFLCGRKHNHEFFYSFFEYLQKNIFTKPWPFLNPEMLAQIKSCCRICHPFIHATGTRKDDYIHKYKEILIFQKTKVLKIHKKISFYFSEYK